MIAFPNLPNPDYPLKEKTEDNTIRSKFEDGSTQVRRKMTKSRRTFTLTWNNLPTKDYKVLDNWVRNIAHFGCEMFNWTNPGTGEEINFDGGFLFGPMRPDNFTLAPRRFAEIKKDMQAKPPEEIRVWLQKYCRRFTTERVACYCNSCLSGLVQGLPEGKRAVHVAELLFP